MTTGRFSRRNATLRQVVDRRSQRENNFFLTIVGFSLFLHIFAATLFLLPAPVTPSQHRPSTLSVDLVMAPVANPQRGGGGRLRQSPPPDIRAKELSPPPPSSANETVTTKEKSRPVRDDDIDDAIARMKDRLAKQAEVRQAEEAIAALRKKTENAAAGSANGTGDETGSAINEWLQQAVKTKWSWPDRRRKELSAEIEVEFDITGRLSNYRFIRHATDSRFDDSLKRALLSLEPLPMTLRKPYRERILFNLDDLQP